MSLPEALRWTAWPLRDDGPAAVPKVLFVAAVITLFFAVFGDLGWLAAVLLPLSLAKWFLPTSYELGADDVAVRFLGLTSRAPWSRFRRFYPHRIGVHLSPFEHPSPLDPFRGLFLRYRGNGDAVVARLEQAGLKRGERKAAS